MKKISFVNSLLLGSLLFSNTLYAENYKKVVLSSYKSESVAQAEYKTLINKINERIGEKKQNSNFDVLVRPSGNFYILAVEPFKYVREAKDILDDLKSSFPSAYISNNAQTFDENEVEETPMKMEETTSKEEPQVEEKLDNIVEETMPDKEEPAMKVLEESKPDVPAYTIEDMIKEIVLTDPEIKERLLQYNSVVEEIDISKAGYYPTIDFLGKTGKKSVEKEGSAKDKFDHSEVTLKLVQNIFNGFGTQAAVNRDKARSKAAFNKYIEVAQDKMYRAVEAYIKVLRYKEVLEIAKDNVKVHEETLIKINDRYDRGFSTLSEVERVKGRLSLAKSNYISETNNLFDAKFNFHKALGRYIDENSLVMPEFTTKLPKTLEHAQDIAIHKNPSILVADEDIKVAQEALKFNKKSNYPTLDLELEATRYNNLSSSSEAREDDRSAMLVLKYNLFNGGADSADQQKHVSLLNYEYAHKNTLKREVMESLALSWSAYKMIAEQYIHQTQYRDLTVKTKVAYDEEFQLGRRTLIDLLDVQDEVNHIKINVIHSTYDLLFSKYRILDAMGELFTSFGHAFKEDYKKDVIRAYPDQDNDKILDCEDQCDNSVVPTTNLYGCEGINCVEVEEINYTMDNVQKDQSDVNVEEVQKLWGAQ